MTDNSFRNCYYFHRRFDSVFLNKICLNFEFFFISIFIFSIFLKFIISSFFVFIIHSACNFSIFDVIFVVIFISFVFIKFAFVFLLTFHFNNNFEIWRTTVWWLILRITHVNTFLFEKNNMSIALIKILNRISFRSVLIWLTIKKTLTK